MEGTTKLAHALIAFKGMVIDQYMTIKKGSSADC
jgi:hypothetical protein